MGTSNQSIYVQHRVQMLPAGSGRIIGQRGAPVFECLSVNYVQGVSISFELTGRVTR